jgi:hypothetical protein
MTQHISSSAHVSVPTKDFFRLLLAAATQGHFRSAARLILLASLPRAKFRSNGSIVPGIRIKVTLGWSFFFKLGAADPDMLSLRVLEDIWLFSNCFEGHLVALNMVKGQRSFTYRKQYGL